MAELYDIDWFEPAQKGVFTEIRAGHVYWAPVPFHWQDPEVWLLREWEESFNEFIPSEYRIRAYDLRNYDMETNPRLDSLKVPHDQFVICTPHKKRPVLVLNEPRRIWQDGSRQGDDVVVVLPISGVHDAAGGYRYSESFLLKVQSLTFPTIFHLAESPCGHLQEGLVRFEWAHTIPVYHLEPFRHAYHRVTLTRTALWLIGLWFCRYLGLDLPKDDEELLDDYRASMQLQLAEYLSSVGEAEGSEEET